MSRLRLRFACLAARAAAAVGRLLGKSGTSLPGKVLLRIDPAAIASLSSTIPGGSMVISATNGKTTTAALAAEALVASGRHPVHNSAGANMAGGIAAALLADGRRSAPESVGLFEVDEFWLPEIGPALGPGFVVLSNLFRDQLDRYGELDTILDRWRAAAAALAASGTRLVLCADDPGIASLSAGLPSGSVVWFGIDDPAHALRSLPHSADASNCRSCGAPLDYDLVLLGHLGHWRCRSCGNARPAPDYSIKHLVLEGAASSTITVSAPSGRSEVRLGLPGIYNAYNALAAWALCSEAGVPPTSITAGLEATSPAFGRAERLQLAGREATLLLIKNPTGANEVIRTLALEPDGLDLVIALNDGTADGRDVSWIWDADFEELSSRIRRVTCTGRRAAEMALRLHYGGVPRERIEIGSEPLADVDRAAASGDGPLWVLPTYTALLDLRSGLEARGDVGAVA